MPYMPSDPYYISSNYVMYLGGRSVSSFIPVFSPYTERL